MKNTEKRAIERLLFCDYLEATEKHDIATDVTPTIRLSNMKKAAGDVHYAWNRYSRIITRIEIRISKSYYEKFGYQRSYETLMHEIAHVAIFDEKKRDSIGGDHGIEFQDWCVKLGGSMSKYMTDAKYMDSTTDEYIDHNKWHYTCPKCGGVIKRVRRISKRIRESQTHTANCCGTDFNKFTETKIG